MAATAEIVEKIIVPLGETHPELVGIVLPFKEGGDDICGLMSDLLGEYGFCPPGVVGDNEIDVEVAVLNLPDIRQYCFDYAVPLRRCEDRKNCLRWNHRTHKWEIIPFNRHLKITGKNVMIIARLL